MADYAKAAKVTASSESLTGLSPSQPLGLTYEADPRHVVLLVESLGLTQANSVATPGAKEPIADYDAQKPHEDDPRPDSDPHKTVRSLTSDMHTHTSRYYVCDSSRCEVELDPARAATGKSDADDAQHPFPRTHCVQSRKIDELLPHDVVK